MKSILLALMLSLMSGSLIAGGRDNQQPVSIEKKTAGMHKQEGFFTFYWDGGKGKIWLELTPNEEEFLYMNSLPHGVGSNDFGLDRGQIDDSRIVFFRRIGPKVLLIQPNYSFRAISDNSDEQTAVDESFAISTLYGFEVAAETNGRVLVDASSFFLRDAGKVALTLKRTKQGSFKLDLSRSALDTSGIRNFPDNTEISALLTFTADTAGNFLRQVVPTPEQLTVIQHHSFIRLPDNNYARRKYDLRSGFFGISFMDFATPIGDPITKRFIARHRLQKKNPAKAISEPVEPIVYYIDRGAPEPIRSALMEGASWWNEAFEAAGYKNAFQVRVLPEGADPMDVRYNVIQWVHRASRGWSYGNAVIDPRTGEIIKGHVSLGSLRARQDYLIAEGLLGPYGNDSTLSNEMLEMSMARLRQLAAHEVGHTLGLRHNFAASTNDRASVMDYPYPLAKLDDKGRIDLSDAYDRGIGEWDIATIIYGYREFGPSIDEDSALQAHLNNVFSSGLLYLSDSDARSPGSSNPRAHLWDNGSDPIDELDRVMKVRRHLLDRFSVHNLAEGRPMALLEEVLVPIYMFHRYQVAATAKLIGGLEYDYALNDGTSHNVTPVNPNEQRRAVESLLKTVQPEALSLPESVIRLIPPHTTGYRNERENFNRRTGETFDPLSAAESAADLTIRMLLHPQRAARLVEYHARDKNMPGLEEVIDQVIAATWKQDHTEGYLGEIGRAVDNIVLHRLFGLAANRNASQQVQAIAFAKIDELSDWIDGTNPNSKPTAQRAHLLFAKSQTGLFQRDPQKFKSYHPANAPAGSPIGSDEELFGRYGCGWR